MGICPDETYFEGQFVAAQHMISGVAARYANALFDLAVEQNAVPATEKSLVALQGLIAESPEFQRLLNSPIFKSEDQMAAIDALSEKAGVTGIAANFTKLMCENRRLPGIRRQPAGNTVRAENPVCSAGHQ